MREANGVVLDRALYLWLRSGTNSNQSAVLLDYCYSKENQRPCSEKTKMYNCTENNKQLFSTIRVLDESRSFFRVHTGYFSNIPKCIKAEFIVSWACSQSSVVSSSQR
ncbi:hypothetical protein TNCV_4445831 [Trichonephila clavipes]|nr:hypothetical protein TNCV_4445831 [Trichonephila clavipes]